MKPRKQKCSGCEGKGKVMTTSDPEVIRITGGMIGECPDCEGEGIEIIITPKQWKQYQELLSHLPVMDSENNK